MLNELEALQTTVAEFNAARPCLAEAGYRVTRVAIEVGPTPKVALALEHQADVADTAFDALLAAHQDNRVLTALLTALRQVSALRAKVSFQGLRFREVRVELGTPQGLELVFQPEEVPAPPPPPLPPEPAAVEQPAAVPEPADEEGPVPPTAEVTALAVLPTGPPAEQVIRFRCGGCGKRLAARSRDIGVQGACRVCGHVNTIPAESQEAS
jgi:hypothetical protein